MKKIIAVIVVIILIVLGVYMTKSKSKVVVKSFADCVKAGYPVMESYPRQCRASDGETYTEDIGNALAVADLIVLETPRPGDKVTSPVVLKGSARGGWYFEASFPAFVYDSNGQELGVGVMQAGDDWMTEEFVPFESQITFSMPTTATGTLILRKDNPSGLPEHDNALLVPIVF
jgi:hypothetical protein